MEEPPNSNAVSNDMTSVFRNLPNTKSTSAEKSLVVYTGSITARTRRRRWFVAAPAIVTLIIAGLAVQTRRSDAGHLAQFSRVTQADRHQSPRTPPSVAGTTRMTYLPKEDPLSLRKASIASFPVRTVTPNGERDGAARSVPDRSVKQVQLADVDSAPRNFSSRLVSNADCRPDSLEDACIYADVMRADRRLRAAYTEAVRIGVPADMMSGINRRWQRAQAFSLRRPDETIRQYDALTELLDDYIAGDQ